MEQATNSFNKGLQMDTHPMVQGTDSLTDCLNGTLITMNGNEVILQNDMGNRRVDNAFLPAGYEPVGMKEYGGVIYVAAYNPITNKSQIGSFPSPQRKQDIPKFEGVNFDFDSFFTKQNIETIEGENNYCYLKSDFQMISLTKDISLRSGDKFVIHADGLSGIGNKLTNYNNISQDKKNVFSPKNKDYTLQIGILNSQNEFVDITKTLCRWYKDEENNNWKIIENAEEVSEIYNFNQGYFIPDTYKKNDGSDTISDYNLILSRQILQANTYSYKLVGPMYLKIIYNHINKFDYNIYGIKNENNVTLWVEGYITYNCPDFSEYSDDYELKKGNDVYTTFEEGTPAFEGTPGFKKGNPIFEGFELYTNIDQYKTNTSQIREKSVYDENSNTYSTKIVKKYEFKNVPDSIKELDYFIGVFASNEKKYSNKNIFLKDLSANGVLDLSLLGSGELSIRDWRFFNNVQERKTTLTISLDAYPEYGKEFSPINFNFKNFTTGEESFNVKNIKPYNGRQTIDINWDDNYIYPRMVYYLQKISYSILDSNIGIDITYDENSQKTIYWLLTTNLFNEFYYSINNFCTTNNKNFKEKMKVKLKLNEDFKVTEKQDQENIIGELLPVSKSEEKEITYKIKHIHSVHINNNSFLEVDEDYPVNITINKDEEKNFSLGWKYKFDDEKGFIEKGKLNEYFKKSLKIVKGSGEDQLNIENETFIEEVFGEYVYDDSLLKGAIYNYDIFKGKLNERITGNINNVFGKFSYIYDKVIPNDYEGSLVEQKYRNRFSGITSCSDADNNWGYLHIIFGQKKIGYSNALVEQQDYLRIGSEDDRGYKVAAFKDAIFNTFNNDNSSEYKLFTYYIDPYNFRAHNINEINRDNFVKGLVGKVWWRDSKGGWALFLQDFIIDSENHDPTNTDMGFEKLKKYLKNQLKFDYIYCLYNNLDIKDSNDSQKLYKIGQNYSYNKSYSHTIHLYINLQSKKTYDKILNIGSKNKIGNLEFIANSLEKYSNDFNEISSYDIVSSANIEDEILDYLTKEIKNIALLSKEENEIIITKDSLNRLLDPNYVYYLSKGKLIRLDEESKLLSIQEKSDFNVLLYNGNTSGEPIWRFEGDVISQGNNVAYRSGVTETIREAEAFDYLKNQYTSSSYRNTEPLLVGKAYMDYSDLKMVYGV